MAELRLDNYERAKKNARVRRHRARSHREQDPGADRDGGQPAGSGLPVSSQVDSAAESMRQTEKAVSELQHLTGLADELQEPPPILDADLRRGAAA